MDNDKQDRFLHWDKLIPVLKALAEPNRLRIFAELMRGNSCYGELQEKLEMPAN